MGLPTRRASDWNAFFNGAAPRLYSGIMRFFGVLLLALTASAQPTLDRLLSAAFPTELTAAPSGAKVAWVSNAKGIRNIMLAEPPSYRSRKITAYTEDDGQELRQLRFTPDASSIVYVRGDSSNGRDGVPNPSLNPAGATEDVWIVPVNNGIPRKIGGGHSPAIAPRGDKVAFVRGGQLWWSALDGAPSQIFKARGGNGRPTWSPDGTLIAFTSARGDHALIGVYEVASSTLRYLDPSTDFDSEPEWSPDSRSIAFLRVPSNGLRTPREPHRTGEPWSIRIASVETGAGREVFRAREGAGSVFRGINARNQILWADGNRLVFPWEADGWAHLYSIANDGGKPTLLTPGAFEVEDVALATNKREIVFSSNQDDIDRRHLWTVAVTGGTPTALTSGQGIECQPAPTTDPNVLVFLKSDAQRPLRAAIRTGASIRDLDPTAIPVDFPTPLAKPQQVIFPAGDGLQIHGQLFLPAKRPISGRSPAMVFFHGGSRRQMLLGWHPMYYYANAYALNQYLASLGYVVLSVNYRSGIGYGMEFREALNYGANGASEYNDVQGAGIYLRTRSDVDAARIGAWGGSYGGYLTAMALARASEMYKVGVDFHGVHDWAKELGIPVTEPDYKIAFESSPMNFLKTWHSPVLLIQGDDDPDVQFNQTVILADALRRQGVEMEEMVIPDEVHDFLLHRSWLAAYNATVRFIERHLMR
ncbi:MAG: peptidase prolyl oligopeptidase active site domain protein [Candidatus Solibacter sp.]|nr:peptidase prolyl oligopeptidase active site domain protein [Candidatus Solibacter sp.]